jgi:hypothetical protein
MFHRNKIWPRNLQFHAELMYMEFQVCANEIWSRNLNFAHGVVKRASPAKCTFHIYKYRTCTENIRARSDARPGFGRSSQSRHERKNPPEPCEKLI